MVVVGDGIAVFLSNVVVCRVKGIVARVKCDGVDCGWESEGRVCLCFGSCCFFSCHFKSCGEFVHWVEMGVVVLVNMWGLAI